MAFDAGSIEGKMTLDRADFYTGLDEAEARARRFADQDWRARLGADDADLVAKIDSAQAKLDRLRAERENIPIGADTAEADRKIDELQAKLDELKRKELEAGSGGAEGFSKLREEVGKVHEESDRLIGKFAEMKGRAVEAFDEAKGKAKEFGDEAVGAGERAAEGMDKVATSGGGLLGMLDNLKGYKGFGGLIGIGAALAPALLPVIGSLAIGVGAFASALTAATLGIGALGILALPILSNIHTDMTKITPLFKAWTEAQPGPQQVAAWKALEDQINKLPQGERQVVQGIVDLKAQLQFLSGAIRPDLLALFGSGLNLVKGILPTLVPLAKTAASALQSLTDTMARHLGDWQHFVGVMNGQVGAAITGFGIAFGKFMVGIGRLMMAFAPLANRFEGDLLNLAQRFEDWAGRLDTPAGLKRMTDYLNKNGPVIHQMLDSLWKDIKILADTLQKIGPGELAGINAVLTAIGKIASIPGVGPFLIQMGLFASVISRLVGPLATVLGPLTRFGLWLSRVSGFTGIMLQLGSEMASMGGAALAAAPEILVVVAALAVLAGGAYAIVRNWKTISTELHKPIWNVVAAGIATLLGPIGWLAFAAVEIAMHWRGLVTAMEAVGRFFSGPFVHFFEAIPRTVARWFNDTVNEIAKFPGQVVRFLARLPGDLLRIATQAGEFLLHGFMTALPKVATFFAELPFKVLTFLVDLPLMLLDLGIKALTFLKNGLIQVVPQIWDFFSSLPGKALSLIEHLVGDLLSFGIRALTSMGSGISSGASGVWDFFTSLPGRVLGFIESLPGRLLSFGSEALHSMASGIVSGAEAVWSFIQSIPGRIIGLLGNLGSLLINAGSELIHGLANGIEHGITSFLGSAIGHVKSLIGDVGKFLGIGSPSRLAIFWGQMMMSGLAGGITAGASQVMGALGSLLGVISNLMGGGVTGAIPRGNFAGMGGGGGVGGGVTFAPQLIVQGNLDRGAVAPVMTGMAGLLSGVGAEMRARGIRVSRIPGSS